MKLYYITSTKDRIGNRREKVRVTEKYNSKAELRKHHSSFYGTLKEIYTEKNIVEKFGEDKLYYWEKEADNMDW